MTTMDRFQRMAVFVAVAEREGFAGAARQLGLSPPAVTRAVAALEAQLGVRLLVRTTRHVRLTDAGARYLEDCRRILADVAEADATAAGLGATPRGRLVVTAPVVFGRLHVVPAIVAYLAQYPEVDVTAIFLDRVVNLLDEGIDVGIRIAHLPDSSLRAVAAGEVVSQLVAAPAYLKRRGRPAHPRDLATHTLIVASPTTPVGEWRFRESGTALATKIRPRFTVNSNEAAIDAATAGFGITRVLSYQVAAHLAAGTLRTVLDGFAPPPVPVHVVHQEGRRVSAKVRTFVDFMVERLRADMAGRGARRERDRHR
jgi:DNA-binding transcriptional LysR family regulator